jgi:hypothetical protein
MNNSHLSPRVLIDRFSSSPSSATSRPISPNEPPHIEPFIPRAPPPLLADNRPYPRNRAISAASTIASPTRTTWSPRKREGSQGDSLQNEVVVMADRRRRASSRGTAGDGEGGHIPFTHHVPAVTVEEDRQSEGTDTEQGYETLLTARPGSSQINDPAQDMAAPINTSPNGHAKLGKRHRLSSLFQIKRKKSSERVVSTPTQLHSNSEHKSDHQKNTDKQRSDREVEMKRREQERHDAELAQGKYLRCPHFRY